MFKKIGCLLFCLVVGLTVFFNREATVCSQTKDAYQIAIFSDLHLSGNNIRETEKIRDLVNSWSDVDLVVALGDLCEDSGDEFELGMAKRFFAKLTKPLKIVVGNHDYIYSDKKQNGKKVKANPEERQAKLERFQKYLGLPALYYTMKVDPYLLIFLSCDELYKSNSTVISEQQLQWLEQQLKENQTTPTIIFFHAPLEGTVSGRLQIAFSEDFMAQPRIRIKNILKENQQVFLWVAGHDHISPMNAAFNNPVNLYQNQVYNLHNPALKGRNFGAETRSGSTTGNGNGFWANFITLYPDRVEIRTYNFINNCWLEQHDRTLRPQLLKTVGQ
jgi:Icc protein